MGKVYIFLIRIKDFFVIWFDLKNKGVGYLCLFLGFRDG